MNMKMNTENELFGELHEQEENGLFGNEHKRQYETQQEALRQSAVIRWWRVVKRKLKCNKNLNKSISLTIIIG